MGAFFPLYFSFLYYFLIAYDFLRVLQAFWCTLLLIPFVFQYSRSENLEKGRSRSGQAAGSRRAAEKFLLKNVLLEGFLKFARQFEDYALH